MLRRSPYSRATNGTAKPPCPVPATAELREALCIVIVQLLQNRKSLNDKQLHALRLLKKSLPATEVIDAEDA